MKSKDWHSYFNKFHALKDPECEALLSALVYRKFKKGQYILTPGQVQNELYFVNSGVQMSFFDTDRKSHVIAFTYANELCADPSSFFSQNPSFFNVQCITDSEMDSISFEKLNDLYDIYPGIERLLRKMTETVLSGMIMRMVQMQSETIEEKFLSFCKRSPHLLQLVPHKYIASYLGMDATNFSKLYNNVRI